MKLCTANEAGEWAYQALHVLTGEEAKASAREWLRTFGAERRLVGDSTNEDTPAKLRELAQRSAK